MLSETTSGAIGTGGAKAVHASKGQADPLVIPNGEVDSGSSRSIGSVAVHATRNAKEPIRRYGKTKNKKTKK
jgi:hypothetical protein